MDGKALVEFDDLISTKELAGRWRCHPQIVGKKLLLLGVPLLQMGRETLGRRSDIKDLEQKIFEGKLPRAGTNNGQGRGRKSACRKVV